MDESNYRPLVDETARDYLERHLVDSNDLVNAVASAANVDEARHLVREFVQLVDVSADGQMTDPVDLRTPLSHAIASLQSRLPNTIQRFLAQQRYETEESAKIVARSDCEWDQAIAVELQRLRNDARAAVLTHTEDALRIANGMRELRSESLHSALALNMANPLEVAQYVRIGHYNLPNSVARFVMQRPTLPALIPLLNRGHIVVKSNTYDSSLEAVIRQVVLDALWHTGPGELSIEVLDPMLRPVMGPFAGLRKAGSLFPERVSRPGEFEHTTERLLREAKRISDLFRGRDMNLGELKQETNSISEVYRLVVILDYPHCLDDRVLSNLTLLLDVGPSCGISFLIHHNMSIDAPTVPNIGNVVSQESIIFVSDSQTVPGWSHELEFCPDRAPSVEESIRAIERVVVSISKSAAPSLDFLQSHAEDPWTHTSADGITATFGRVGQDSLQITLGSEMTQLHNVLVSGAVGQGKSVLLMALVHSIAYRYSPDEVEMYLVDLKEGLTLKPLARDDENTDSYMPHARVIALESDSAFATAVLEHLVFEFERRADIMRDHGENLLQYRRIHPSQRMPRILVVIDEFQKLFTSDEYWSTRALDNLVQIAREGRAYGIHLILASQTLSGITGILSQQDGIFAQFPIRLALRNSESESRVVLGPDNREAADLRFRGEVVVNEDFGAVASNRRGVVADASDRQALAQLRRSLCGKLQEQADMRVFDGSSPAVMIEYRSRLAELLPQEEARWIERYAVVGASLSVDRRLAGVRLSGSSGGHLAILGHGRSRPRRPGIRVSADGLNGPRDLALGSLMAATIGLAVQHPQRDAMFVFLDVLDQYESTDIQLETVLSILKGRGFEVEHYIGQQVEEYFSRLSHLLSERSPSDDSMYLIGLGLDRINLSNEEVTTLSMDHSGPLERGKSVSSPLEGIRYLIRSGTAANARLLAWWSLKVSFDEAVGFDGRDHVTGLLALGIDRSDVFELIGRQIDWRFQSNRGLLQELGYGDPEVIIPFSAPTPSEIEELLATTGDR